MIFYADVRVYDYYVTTVYANTAQIPGGDVSESHRI